MKPTLQQVMDLNPEGSQRFVSREGRMHPVRILGGGHTHRGHHRILVEWLDHTGAPGGPREYVRSYQLVPPAGTPEAFRALIERLRPHVGDALAMGFDIQDIQDAVKNAE